MACRIYIVFNRFIPVFHIFPTVIPQGIFPTARCKPHNRYGTSVRPR